MKTWEELVCAMSFRLEIYYTTCILGLLVRILMSDGDQRRSYQPGYYASFLLGNFRDYL